MHKNRAKDKTVPETPASKRSQLMARIRSKDTAPEKRVRRVLFAMGYRFRIHRKDLPGCPDVAFISRKKVIFVNGCFWHQHPGCSRATLPATHQDYWLPKLERNRNRDIRVADQLLKDGWKVLIVWECETSNDIWLRRTLKKFLGNPRLSSSRK